MMTPIIMESEIDVVGEKLAALRQAGIGQVHIDVGDGLFSDMLSIAPADLQQFELTSFQIDFHLLVDDPMEWVEECVALSPKRIIGQVEHMGNQELFVDTVQGYGTQAGLALAIETPIEAIAPSLLSRVGTVLLMAVPVGTSGSVFDQRVLAKIAQLRAVYTGSILVDGGINPSTYSEVIAAGATEAGANSSWWRGEWGEVIRNKKIETSN
jgi:ribulose-phosphate 3-epimerase